MEEKGFNFEPLITKMPCKVLGELDKHVCYFLTLQP